ncbi:hypothetical protein BDC45DRAFT_594573 [Circinella umbellata]|nr:hypothetical protein BDC45DRAFT_594573 [Circinella umbellata]
MSMSTNTSFNNLFSDEDIFNQQEQVSLTNRFEISEDLNCSKQDFDKFKEDTEKRLERIENALFAATKHREQIITLLQGLSDKAAHPSPPPPSSDAAAPLPESFVEPKSKSPKAILQALTDIDGSAEQGKQSLITLQYTIERVIKDKETEVSDDIKKAPWTALSTIQKDLKDSITSEVVKEVKKVLPHFPHDLNDGIMLELVRGVAKGMKVTNDVELTPTLPLTNKNKPPISSYEASFITRLV